MYDFMGELAGNTLLGRIFVNESAALFAVGLRNWMYSFEHINYVYAEDSNERPCR